MKCRDRILGKVLNDDVAKVVYDNFWPIFKKYKALVGEELKAKRKAELEKELATLNGGEE